ncbi:MAG: bifunctional tRNA (5-methylaminomethyl-2-thiouridine)(34)-methyltransferase MnmD/FAD-dependent 5-carboxymethylaminomethyl-2-thiouridine(34) oxidoreductase MnmC [Betaproteobacteria bacterium]|nr:bifunctional tRNA (5-methylaminomethyl-2-thiouridine)(34)-methyltransferase MnmD/FAD-dependent 5-carboxymethylaminomethyl-2-thiouridine(34) oxidoreductase MnmC [Betaproteobacteria bacterium]
MWLEPARLEFGPEGTPFSAAYGDIYHSVQGGPEQARHVFIGGNGLPARWRGRERYVILETGFGLGLNFLATWAAWQADPQRCRRLHFVSVEKHPFSATDLRTAQAAWPEFAPLAEELRERWPPLVPGVHRLNLAGGQVILTVVFGDAVEVLRKIDAAVDAFYLDGFSPARNPELWSPPLCRSLARLAAPGATLATWSVAGGVREALTAAEFDLEKRPGFAGKRQMLVGRYRSRKPDTRQLPPDRRAIVLGAGVAGSTAAHRLAARGWQVTVLDRRAAPGLGASGNLAGVLRPLPSVDDNRLARLTRAGYLATRALLRDLGHTVRWNPCGVLHLARDAAHEDVQRRTVATLLPPEEFLQFIDRDAAARRLGWPVNTGGWWFPAGGWVQPASLCLAALGAFPERIAAHFGQAVTRLERGTDAWLARDAEGHILAAAPHLIVAAGAEARQLAPFSRLPQRRARGQVSHLPRGATPPLDVVLCSLGYATPAVDGFHLAGASFTLEDEETAERITDHRDNLARLELMLPGFTRGLAAESLGGRVGFRPASPDRLPLVGAVPDFSAPRTATRLVDLARLPGLWCLQGYGARGIVWSGLMAELLASRLDGDPLPLGGDLADAVDPGRFALARGKTAPHPVVEAEASRPGKD